jgi:hypothetical protein
MRAFHKFVVLEFIGMASPKGYKAHTISSTKILKKQIIYEQNSQKTV